jgi:hypothetical protein
MHSTNFHLLRNLILDLAGKKLRQTRGRGYWERGRKREIERERKREGVSTIGVLASER